MITISHHAFIRAKERLGLNPDAFKRIVAMAFAYGTQQQETRGKLNHYLKAICFEHPTNDIRLYGENIFIFKEGVCVTVYQIPLALRKNLKHKK